VEFRDGQVIRDRSTVAEAQGNADNSKLRELFLNRRIASPLASIGEAIRMALRSLTSNIFRTFLTLLGIVSG